MSKLDLTNYEGGREHAYIKHYLLEKYLSSWGYKIGSTWDTLVFIDGFAGPWGTKDENFADASFGIAIKALSEAVAGLHEMRQRSVRGVCVFVEKAPKPFAKLEAFAKSHSTDRIRAKALKGRFVENIPTIDKYVASAGANPFKLVFLDQKGWAATPLLKLRPFVGTRSCELLFNLMTSFLTRFVDRHTLAESYHSLYGRAEVIDKIRALPKGTGQREEVAVDEYCRSLREICGFQYVSQAIIMDPTKERVRYYLVFATNSLHGIEVFKKAELGAAQAQDKVRHEKQVTKTGQTTFLFGDGPPPSPKVSSLHQHHLQRAREKLIRVIADSGDSALPYEEIFGEAMAFPLVTPEDLQKWVIELKDKGALRIIWDGMNRKKLSWLKKDSVMLLDAGLLR
jgi:three-Cys-motif partner protein